MPVLGGCTLSIHRGDQILRYAPKVSDRIDAPRLHPAFDLHGELPTQRQDLRGQCALPPDRETTGPCQIGQYF